MKVNLIFLKKKLIKIKALLKPILEQAELDEDEELYQTILELDDHFQETLDRLEDKY